MYATALKFSPKMAAIEQCEADFIAVVAGGIDESPVQILFGEAKTHTPFDVTDVRKLGRLADAIPRDLAQTFILFAKTDAFTSDEIALGQTLNESHRQRVILWSQEELEPYGVYERSEGRVGQSLYATTLTEMARATHHLWFV